MLSNYVYINHYHFYMFLYNYHVSILCQYNSLINDVKDCSLLGLALLASSRIFVVFLATNNTILLNTNK